MTARELIEKLKEFPPDMRVFAGAEEGFIVHEVYISSLKWWHDDAEKMIFLVG